MKKFLLGVSSLIMPMALVVYGCNVINTLATVILACASVVFMIGYTMNKFKLVGKRGYKDIYDSFGYASVGNAVTAFVFLFLTFVGARMTVAGFSGDIMRFSALMAGVAYIALIGIVASAIYLVRNKWIDGWQTTQMYSIIGFTACIGFACAYEALKPYGLVVPEQIGNIITGLLMVSGLCLVVCGYKLTVYDVEHA